MNPRRLSVFLLLLFLLPVHSVASPELKIVSPSNGAVYPTPYTKLSLTSNESVNWIINDMNVARNISSLRTTIYGDTGLYTLKITAIRMADNSSIFREVSFSLINGKSPITVTSCGFLLANASYVLVNDLTEATSFPLPTPPVGAFSNTCFIMGENTKLNLDGHVVNGTRQDIFPTLVATAASVNNNTIIANGTFTGYSIGIGDPRRVFTFLKTFNVTISNVSIIETDDSAINMHNTEHLTIENNTFFNIVHDSLAIFVGTKNSLISGNRFGKRLFGGIFTDAVLEEPRSPSENITIIDNEFRNQFFVLGRVGAITSQFTNNSRIENNRILDSAIGINIFEDTFGGRQEIRNNFIENTKSPIVLAGEAFNVDILNNSIINSEIGIGFGIPLPSGVPTPFPFGAAVDNIRILNNSFINISQGGINITYVAGSSLLRRLTNGLIESNTFSNTTTGISLDFSSIGIEHQFNNRISSNFITTSSRGIDVIRPIRINGLEVVGNTISKTSDAGLSLFGARGAIVVNNIINSSAIGLIVEKGLGNRFLGNLAEFNGLGMVVESSVKEFISGGSFSDNSKDGIFVNNSNFTTIVGIEASRNGQNGTHFRFSNFNNVSSSDFKDNKNDDIKLFKTNHSHVTDNHIIVGGAPGIGIHVTTSESFVLAGNTILGPPGRRIVIDPSKNFIIFNNTLIDGDVGIEIIDDSNGTVLSNFILNNTQGIIANDSTQIRIINNILNSTEFDIISDNSNSTLAGNVLQSIKVLWSLNLEVFDTSDVPLQGARADIKDSTGNSVFSGFTNNNGILPTQRLVQLIQNRTITTFFTPHQLTVSKRGFIAENVSVNMNESRKVKIKLSRSNPLWFDNTTTPLSPAVFVPGQTYNFSVRWVDDEAIDTVLIEHNFTGNLTNETIPHPDLMGYWKLDEGSGTFAADSSGHNRHGTVDGAVEFVNGAFGNAINVNADNNRVNMGNASFFNTPVITISAWVKAASCIGDVGTMAVVAKIFSDTSSYTLIYNRSSCVPGFAWTTDGTNFRLVEAVNGLETNKWNHVFATYNGSLARIYVNGTPVPTAVILGPVSGFIAPSTSNLTIGSTHTFFGDFNGIIDEVQIWTRALASEEVENLFMERLLKAGGFTFTAFNLTAGNYVWRQIANDTSGNVNSTDRFLYQILSPMPEITVDIDPDTLNLKSKGRWITAYLESLNASQLDVSSILLNGTIHAETGPFGFVKSPDVIDRDEDGTPELMVKFNRTLVQKISPTGEVTYNITGKMAGRDFEAFDTIMVIGENETHLSIRKIYPEGLRRGARVRVLTIIENTGNLDARDLRISETLPQGQISRNLEDLKADRKWVIVDYMDVPAEADEYVSRTAVDATSGVSVLKQSKVFRENIRKHEERAVKAVSGDKSSGSPAVHGGGPPEGRGPPDNPPGQSKKEGN